MVRITAGYTLDGSIYERELAGILSGHKPHLDKFLARLPAEDRFLVSTIGDKPFFVTRSAGSLGADLIALRNDFSMVIEVKSSLKKTIAFSEASGKRQEQAERLNRLCSEAGLFLMYAFRLKSIRGDGWRLYSVMGEPKGKQLLLYNLLPKVSSTKGNNYMIKWDEGLPLVKLIKYVNEE